MNTHYAVRIHKNVLRVLIGVAIIGVASFAGYKYARSAPVTIQKYFVYQGRLTQPDGSPVASNVYNLQFGVYADASATAKICDSTNENVVVKQGVFRVSIGQGAPGATGSCGTTDMQAELATRPEIWLAISVKGPNDSVYQALSPLVQVGATPRALYAANAGRAQVASGAEGDLKAYIDTLIPPGAVIAYAATTPPAGWLLCDGAPVSRNQYAVLFAAIGTAHGTGDGATTFNLPDYRGRFLRGVDRGVGRDPGGRVAMTGGGNVGDQVGSVQNYATALPASPFLTSTNGSHDHAIRFQGYRSVAAGSYISTFSFQNYVGSDYEAIDHAGDHSHSVASGGDTETRPINAYVNYIIKY